MFYLIGVSNFMHSALWPSRGMTGTLVALGISLGIPIVSSIVMPLLSPQAVSALSLDRLNQVAQGITVRIDAERPGSGVIIHRQDDTYTVLTVRHLVAVQDRYAVITSDGGRYPVNFKAIQTIPDTDLALVEFRSRRDYPIAQLANYSPRPDQYLFLSGFPAPSEGGVSEQIRLFIPGQLVPFEQAMAVSADPISQGYRLFYNNIAEAGMSGGAILDTDGRVIGVHGRSDGEDMEDAETGKRRRLRLGISAGLPIRWLIKLRPELQLRAANDYPKNLSGDELKAVEQSIQTLTITPSGELNALTWANYANLMYRARRFPEALKAINKSLEIKFQYPQFWYAQGLILMEMKQNQDAINAFDRALKLQPKFYRALKSKAMTLVAMNRYQEAVETTDSALKLEGKSSVVWFLRGNILSRHLQDFEGAVDAFDRAISVEPDFPAAWVERSRALHQMNRTSEALSSVNQALILDPEDRSARELRQFLEKQLQQR